MSDNILETYIKTEGLSVADQSYEAYIAHKDMVVIDNERTLPAPRSIRAEQKFNDVRGFVEYCRDFKSESTVIFASATEAKAIFDYHQKDSPSWCSHTATLSLKKASGWDLWQKNNNQWKKQEDFADFLDRGVSEVIVPTQADLLELVRQFRVTSKMEVDADISAGGSTLNFREETRGKPAKESIEMPEKITVRLLPYEGAERINSYIDDISKHIVHFEMQARLYWRFERSTDRGSLQFKYSLLNLDKAEDETLESIRAALSGATGIKTYIA